MPHVILLTYLLSFCCGVALIALAVHMSRAFRYRHLKTYGLHLACLSTMALSVMVLRYIQLNVSPAKEGIVGGLYILVMGLSALDFCAIVGCVATFILMTLELRERTPAAWLKAAGGLALVAAALVWAKGVYDIIMGRSVDVLMISLWVLDYLSKAVLLLLAVLLFRQAQRLPRSGKRIALEGLAMLYTSVHVGFFVIYALRRHAPFLFSFSWPLYFLLLSLVPLFTLGTFLHYYHGKKLYVSSGTDGHEAALGSRGVSRRELEVIRLVCTGKSNREIEGLLYISEKTVKFHLYNAYKKLGIRNRVELVNLMHDLGAEEPTPPA